MALVYQQDINENTRWGIWKLEEAEAFFDQIASSIPAISHPHKRLQTLAGRYLLKYLMPEIPLELVQVAPTRKPFLPNDPFHFSISHCEDYVAAIISKDLPVGIDVELPKAKMQFLQNKFLSVEERKVLRYDWWEPTRQYTIGWSAKEAVFKWYGKGEVRFKEHIHLEKLKVKGNRFEIEGSFLKEGPHPIRLNGRWFEKLCCVYLYG
jgi:phosphopantetheinyl transferase